MLEKINQFFEKNDSIFEYLQLFNYVLSVLTYFAFWIFPTHFSSTFLTNTIHLFLVEFIMIHSGIFMSILARKRSLSLFIILYGCIIYFLSRAFENDYYIFLYLLIIVNRTRVVFYPVNNLVHNKNIIYSFAGAFFFLITAFSMILFHHIIPAYGITTEYLVHSGFNWQNDGAKGALVDKPQLVIYFWVIYFSLWCCFEYYVLRNKEELNERFNNFRF